MSPQPHPIPPAVREVAVVVVSEQYVAWTGESSAWFFRCGVDNHAEDGTNCLVSKFYSLVTWQLYSAAVTEIQSLASTFLIVADVIMS